MRSRKILGIVIVIIGIVCLCISNYIKHQVDAGKIQISEGQSKVDSANSVFSLNPVSKEVGKGLTSGAQDKINAGKMQVAHYGQVAMWFQVGGYVLIVIGAIVFFTGFGRKKPDHTHHH